MKLATLTAGRIHEALNAIVAIANEPRQIPALAKYRLARMHDALEPAYTKIEAKRLDLVQRFGEEKFAPNPQDPATPRSLGWGLYPQDKTFPEYIAAWKAICEETVEVKVDTIPLMALGNDPKGVELGEFKQLGELIEDNEPKPEPTE